MSALDGEIVLADVHTFITFRQPTELTQHNAADGVVFVLAEFSAEVLVELVHRRHRLHHEFIALARLDQVVVVKIVLVADLAHDLLQHILDRHQARHLAVFIHHDRHVGAGLAEFPQQHIQALAFRHAGGGADHFLQRGFVQPVAEHQIQQIFRQQDADDVVRRITVDGEAGVGGFNDEGQVFFRLRRGGQHHALRARHHDLPHLHVGHLHGALEDPQRFGIDQPGAVGIGQDFQNFGLGGWLTGKKVRDFVEKGSAR